MTTPAQNPDDILSWTFYSNGKKGGDSLILSSATLFLGLNRIGKAFFKFDASSLDSFSSPETDDDFFKPGKLIRFEAGPLGKEAVLFSGHVTRLGIEMNQGARPQMVVECRDIAFPATMGRSNKIFENKKDSDIISEVLKQYGAVSVDATSVKYPSLVQYYSTDWDFALSRAEVNGLFLSVKNDKIEVKKPSLSGSSVLTVTYGTDLFEFNAGYSVLDQYSSVKAVSWNPDKQEIEEAEASSPTLNKQGNLGKSDLQGEKTHLYQTASPLSRDSLKNWMDAQNLKEGLSRFLGDFLIAGNALVTPGSLVELQGLGKRFDGNVFVGWVEHTFKNNTWQTRIGTGVSSRNITERADTTAPPAAGWLPGIEGLQTARVCKWEGDPEKQNRILVEFPLWKTGNNKVWARLSSCYASSGFGLVVLPEKEDEVLVGFMNNDPGAPVILGSLYSKKKAPPQTWDEKNNIKMLLTRSKIRISIDEEKKVLTLETPGKNTVELDDDKKAVTVSDQNKNTVILDQNGISLSSAKNLKLTAKGDIILDAVGKTNISAKTDLALSAMNINAEAKMGLTAKGSAKAELSASGQTVVKGGIVMIN